jgi:hypothetical protein
MAGRLQWLNKLSGRHKNDGEAVRRQEQCEGVMVKPVKPTSDLLHSVPTFLHCIDRCWLKL